MDRHGLPAHRVHDLVVDCALPALVRGCERVSDQVSELKTPSWIQQIIDTSKSGGWITPIPLTEDHPLVVEEWTCSYCDRPFLVYSLLIQLIGEEQYAIVMPFRGHPQGPRWIATHRKCSLETLGLGFEFVPPLQ